MFDASLEDPPSGATARKRSWLSLILREETGTRPPGLKQLSPRSAYPPHRNPMLLFRFVGSFLLRFETRTFRGLLFHEPPRTMAVLRCI